CELRGTVPTPRHAYKVTSVHQSQPGLEDLDHFLDGGGAAHLLQAREDGELGPAAGTRLLRHDEERSVMRVAEDREGGEARAMVDGVVAPGAVRHPPAVQRQEEVELASVEECGWSLSAAVGEANDLRHA